MKFLGNIIWLIFGGLITSIEYLVSSLLLMVTIIGIPFGLQTLKLALLVCGLLVARLRIMAIPEVASALS